jgi:hypothetical protein
MTTPPTIPHVPISVSQSGWMGWIGQIARTVNLLLRGKDNSTAIVTLTPSAASTTLVDERIGLFSVVLLEAQTASAAQARSSGMYVVSRSGQAVIHHAIYAAVDQTFGAIIRG